MLGFAPADTDIVFCSDIESLGKSLGAGRAAPDSSALKRLAELRDKLGVDGLKTVQIDAVCTFHVRATAHQVVVLELAKAPPPWLAQLLAKQDVHTREHQFLVFSRTPKLAADSQWSSPPQLTPALAQATKSLLRHRNWAVVELSDAARRRLVTSTGIQGEIPELQRLQQIRFTGSISGSDDLALDLSGQYATADEAATLGPKLARWLPFENAPALKIQGTEAKLSIQHVTFDQLNQFLSRF
jgi:hypothetical protein